MKTKFPFKYNQIAALLMLSPLGVAHAAAPLFLESSTVGTDFELLFTVHDSASNSLLLDIDDSNNVHLGFRSNIDSKPMYANYKNGVVSTPHAFEAVGSSIANSHPSVLVNPAVDNGLVTVYIQDGIAKVATSSDNGTSWTVSANTMDISIITNADAAQKLARIKTSIDSQGKVYVAYTTTSAGVTGRFHINSYDTSTDTWADETGEAVAARLPNRLDFSVTDGAMDIVVGPDDTPYAIYRKASGHMSAIYTPDDTGTWQSFEIFTSGAVRVRQAESTTLSVDNNGSLYVFASGDDITDYHADLYKVTGFDGVNARVELVAVDLLDKLTVTPNILNTDGNTDVISDGHSHTSRPVFDSNNNIYLAFTDYSVADTKDFIVARIDAITGDITRLNNNYKAVTGLDAPSEGFNTVDLAIDENDLPVVVFNEGTPTVMRLGLVASGELLAYSVNEGDLVVGDLTGMDSDGDAITYTITDDLVGDAANSAAALFQVNTITDQLEFIAPVAATVTDTDEIFNLTVQATANGESTSVNVVVTLVNVSNDFDQDGLNDDVDDFPFEFLETDDLDDDGIPDDEDDDIDGDNVLNEDDAFPFDKNETLDSDVDGVGDNADDFPLDSSETNDADGDGVGDNADPHIDDPNDLSAPVISFVNGQAVSFVINATGLTNQINEDDLLDFIANNLTATDKLAAHDNREAIVDIIVASDINTQLASGVHNVQLSATDNSANETFLDLDVHINPAVKLSADLVVEAGSTLLVPIKLLGRAPVYPAEIVYTVTSSSTGITSEELTLTISDTESSPVISYALNGEQSGETIVITLVSALNASIIEEENDVGELVKPSITANVISGNVAPVVNFSLSQLNDVDLYQSVAVISGSVDPETYRALAKVTVNVVDVNASDTHCITFTSSDGTLTEYVAPDDVIDPEAEPVSVVDCNLSNTFIFDPTELSIERHRLDVTVVENHSSAPFTIDKSIDITIRDLVSIVPDSNQNRIFDAQESISSVNDSTVLPIVTDEAPLQVAAGLSLSLGDIAFETRFTHGFDASIDGNNIETDLHFIRLSDIINFNVEGLQQVGDSVSIVVPLTGSTVIPADAIYRKYTDVDGWFDFVEDANNQIASALKDTQGNCPAPNSVSYTQGLTENDNCIQLTIEDGGLNDGDSMANGTVVDPGVLVTETDNIAPVIDSLRTHSTNSGEEFSLDAVVSDFEGDDIRYTWTQVDTDPALLAEVIDANANTGVFIAPIVEVTTELTFSLTINDGLDDSQPQLFTVKVETVNLKPDHEVDREVGSFGWVMGLFTLAGLVLRRKSKNT